MPTNTNTINIAKVCIYLTQRAIALGEEKDTLLPGKIFSVMNAVKAYNDGDPNNGYLTQMANYLYSICGGYAFQAQNILNLGGGGIVATSPNGNGLTPYPIALVLASGNISGTTIKAINQSDWYGLSGFSFCFINQGELTMGVQFTYNSATGIFDFGLYPYTPQVGDVFSCQAFKSV
jgi:hypothetical protein